MKNIRFFYLKIFMFLEVKFSIYLNRRVFVVFSIRFVKEEYLAIISYYSIKTYIVGIHLKRPAKSS